MTLAVTPELVERTAAELAADGWRYTLRQLYYAVCAEAEIPANNAAANGEMATGVLLAVVALILIHFTVVFAALLSFAAVLIAFGVATRPRRRPPAGRVLAVSYASFAAAYATAELPGRVGDTPPEAPAGAGAVALVCDTPESACAVAANLAVAGLGDLRVLSADAVSADAAPRTAIALHDASPRGCAMVLDLRDAGCEVIDAGLRPADVDSPATQVLEGAPARMPRDLHPLLGDDEVAWLMSGRRVELATRGPRELLALVRRAVEQLQPAPR